MEHFASGRHKAGMKCMHEFFDNNIFMYFEPHNATQAVSDQKKDEYKIGVEHSSLQQVSISMKNFLFEASSKLLEETLRWAQLNHHETEVQYSLLQKGQIMHKLGDSKMHFTFVEDALSKALAFNNYSVQIQACMQLIATDSIYDLNSLRKETGQYRNLNSSLIINNAFVKLLIDSSIKPAKASIRELALLRTTMLNQRRDYLCSLGFRKRNLALKQNKASALSKLDPNEVSNSTEIPDKVTLAEYLHLEQLLDDSCESFYKAWERILPRTAVGGRLKTQSDLLSSSQSDYEACFFQAYFQAKLLLRRRTLDAVDTYVVWMENVTKRFPEPLLVFKLWAFRNDLMLERGAHEQAFTSSQFLLKNLEGSGYKKGKQGCDQTSSSSRNTRSPWCCFGVANTSELLKNLTLQSQQRKNTRSTILMSSANCLRSK